MEAFYKRLPSFCTTNGLIKVPRDRFPDMMIGVSLWGDEKDEKILRGKDTFAVSSKNYEGDLYVYYLYSLHGQDILNPLIPVSVKIAVSLELEHPVRLSSYGYSKHDNSET